MTLRSRTELCWVNGSSNFFPKMEFGKPCLGESMWVLKPYLRFFGNLAIRTSGQALWLRRSSSSHKDLSQLGMDRKFAFGRINGQANLPSDSNIRLCMLLYEIRATRSLRCWEPPPQMFRSGEVYLEQDKHLGMLCLSDWIPYICRTVQISFIGISRRMVNSRLIPCIEL